MNTNQKIKELIRGYKKAQDDCEYEWRVGNIIKDLEALLEPCNHESLKRVVGSQHGAILYKYNECKDCGKVIR